MTSSKFDQLSSLVLVDILASLPMEHVVRLSSLGHGGLRRTSSSKWVTDRMTDVTFWKIYQAYWAGGDLWKFCTNSTIKRLNGTVVIPNIDFNDFHRPFPYIQLIKQVPGTLHFCYGIDRCEGKEARIRCDWFERAVVGIANLTYVSAPPMIHLPYLINKAPSMVFAYNYSTDGNPHCVLYRPALLNGRHIIDVLRAVCGPADVDQAELDRMKTEATEGAQHLWYGTEEEGGWEGVWGTEWHGATVTAAPPAL